MERAVITHAHGDHARTGNQHYLAAAPGEGILRWRLGQDINLQTLAYGERLVHHGVTLSFHPAGHVLGSAQVRLEYQGEVCGVWRLQGRARWHLCAFRTGALPHLYHRIHLRPADLPLAAPGADFAGINDWWQANIANGKASVLFCYSFGKAQRILHGLDASIGPILSHGAVEPLNRVYREAGIYIPETCMPATSKTDPLLRQALIIAPPSAGGSTWMRRFGDYSDAFASGWMRLRGTRRRRGVDRGFVLGPRRLAWLVVGHRTNRRTPGDGHPWFGGCVGASPAGKGLDAQGFSTEYGDDEEEVTA